MIGQPEREPDMYAGAFLLTAIFGCLIGIAGAVLHSPQTTWIGVALIVGGGTGMGIFLYRSSRDCGCGVTRSFGRVVRVTTKMILEIVGQMLP
ncbi:MAG TPA: hypothetical protein VF834_21995 [Streptosporangiaceae bacterium]